MTRLAACLDCNAIIGPGMARCYECRRLRSAIYNASRPTHHALYSTAAWRRLSAEVRAGASRCHWCLKPTRRLAADHVIPLDARPDLALERANLVPACVPCNTRRGRNARLPDLDPTSPVGFGAARREPVLLRTAGRHPEADVTPTATTGDPAA